MRIEEQTVRGWKTCSRDRVGTGGCQGYESEEIDIVQETTSVTFGDVGSPAGDPYHPLLSHQHVRLRALDDADARCAHCGGPVSISLEPRAEYRRLSPAGPDQLVEQARLERERDVRAEQQLDAGERQALALETLAAGLARATQPKDDTEARELRATLAEQTTRMARMAEQLERQESVIEELQPPRRPPGRPRKAESENGNGDAPPPQPRKRASS